ncbi:kinesin heavy chain [Drosophila innubila]|uniref:kinesin heavy chain n=1 Tax=Drosophila innubila TaxID=198719 RepID=UPI00148CD480|nr:kinesin heavy chain [Drosophila innubila]
MAKVYLFRKMESGLNQQQLEICDEAISSILDDVFKGNTSTIINYCDLPAFSPFGDQIEKQDILGRILNQLFSHVYAMEVTMELNICINHMLFFYESNTATAIEDINRDQNRDHFVASPIAAYLYMRRILNQFLPNDQRKCSHVRFTICVRQTNLEESLNLNGKLQLIHLMRVDQVELNKLTTPLSSLFKMISALAKNRKTHLRYYNIRLEGLLKELLGYNKSTVIINYTMQDPTLKSAKIGCVKLWKALYKRKFKMYKSLHDKLLGVEFLHDGHQLELDDIVNILKKNDNNCRLKLEVRKRLSGEINYTNKSENVKQPPVVYEEVQKIKLDAKVNIENILELQEIVAKLANNLQQSVQQLEEKNKMIGRLNGMLAKANNEVQEQRILYQRNLAFYSEMFKRLWRQQSNTLKLQEQQRDEQLAEMFDTICNELHGTLLPQLATIDGHLDATNESCGR